MSTAIEMIKGAYLKLGIKTSDSAIEQDELQSALDTFNDMMMELESSGVSFGFFRVKSAADKINIPEGTQNGIKSMLAGYLAPNLDIAISPTLAAQIDVSTTRMLKILREPLKVEYPSILPTGSGNNCGGYFDDHNFFSGGKKENF